MLGKLFRKEPTPEESAAIQEAEESARKEKEEAERRKEEEQARLEAEKREQEEREKQNYIFDYENGSAYIIDEVPTYTDLEENNQIAKKEIWSEIEKMENRYFLDHEHLEYLFYLKWREKWKGDEIYLLLFLGEQLYNNDTTAIRQLLSLEYILEKHRHDDIRGLVSLHGQINYYINRIDSGYFRTNTTSEVTNSLNSYLNNKFRSLLVNRFTRVFHEYINFIENCAWSGTYAFNLVYHFKLKDSDGDYLEMRPMGDNHWKLTCMSGNDIVRESSVKGILEDASSYLGTEITTRYENSHVIIEPVEEAKPNDIPENAMLKTEDMMHDYIIFGEDFEEKFGRKVSDSKHLLIVGQSGSGKSVLQQTIIAQIYHNIDLIEHIYLIDLKGGVEFFEHLEKDKTTVIEEAEKLLEVTEEVVAKVRERFAYLKNNKIKSFDGPKIFFIVDEFAQINYWKPETRELQNAKSRLKSNLNILSTLGRAAGIRLICGLQRCTTDEMDSGFKNNLHDRILMKSNHPQIFEEVFGGHDFDGIILPRASTLQAGEILYLEDGAAHPYYLKVPVTEGI